MFKKIITEGMRTVNYWFIGNIKGLGGVKGLEFYRVYGFVDFIEGKFREENDKMKFLNYSIMSSFLNGNLISISPNIHCY